MTEHITTAAVDRWLTEHHALFVDELAGRLDLDAGLEEVLLGERHYELVEKVRSNLDLDAGLAAILPPEPEPLPAAVEDEVQPGSLPWVSATLAQMPLQYRLRLRALYANELSFIARSAVAFAQNDPRPKALEEIKTAAQAVLGSADTGQQRVVRWYMKEHPAKSADITVYRGEVEFSEEPFTLLDLTRGTGSPLDEPWKVWYPHLVSDRGPIAQGLAKYSSAQSGWASPQPEPQQWAASIGAFIGALLDDDVPEPPMIPHPRAVAERLHQVAGYVMCVEQMLNDFTDVDLRNVELAGIPLDGVRWSEATTQWPKEWREEIEQNSISLGDGLFEIHYGTTTHTGRGTLV
ncbi:hypothetical protein ACGF5S_32745 [Nocardia nova]|uniref:hypothetical protein n=1 Tax=Nocardia nova TaxID=37330 RepID=UPI003723896B